MISRVIHAEVNDQGILNLTVKGLSPGEVEVILRIPDSDSDRHSLTDVARIPLGGYQAGWLKPEHLRRESIYEEDA